jgi:SAM-dependent methyltransferase
MTSHLEAIRSAEAAVVQPLFRPGARVLELGGANGYQASLLSSWGLEVESIDLAGRTKGPMHFPVIDYDGRHIPFGDAEFDYVFSSNVLEHIRDLDGTFEEMKRVARPGARFIHLLPTASWRWWTNVAHWPFLFGRYVLRRRTLGMDIAAPASIAEGARKRGLLFLLKRAVLPAPHGEYPNALAELYYFSAARWRREFRRHGFELIEQRPGGIFYTGYGLAPGFGVTARRRASRILGSACTVFVLEERR